MIVLKYAYIAQNNILPISGAADGEKLKFLSYPWSKGKPKYFQVARKLMQKIIKHLGWTDMEVISSIL